MNAEGIRITVTHDADGPAFVRVLAALVNPSPMYLASTARLADGTTRCTFLMRHRPGEVSSAVVDDVLARVGSRFAWTDLQPLVASAA